MKTSIKNLRIIGLFLFIASSSPGQDLPQYRVVMAINQSDSTNQRWMVRQLTNLKIALPDAQVHVVCYGTGLFTLVNRSSVVAADIQKLMGDGVVFEACENSMAGAGVTREELVAGCNTVKAGIATLVMRQGQGWQYIFGPK